MSTTWGRDWIKFYLHPSAQWELLPLSARGLGDELLRYVDRTTGSVALGKDPLSALCRLLGAHPRERRRVLEDLEVLKADGFCSLSDEGVLVVRNYLQAQAAVSPVTERVRATRARQAEAALKHSSDAPATLQRREQTFPEHSSDASKHSASSETVATPRKDTEQSVTETLFLEETEKRLEEKQKREEGGAGEEPPSPPTEGKDFQLTASTEKSKRSKKPKAPTADREPPAGSLANSVRAAIVADPALAPIVGNPGDFAMRITEPGAYPGVDALAEVRRAGEFASRSPGKYSDGRAFLSRWLKRAADDHASKPKPATHAPVAARSPFRSVEEAVAAAKAAKERRAAEAAGGSA